jgi:hypothetical protein
MSRSWSKGSTWRWRKLRAAVLAENLERNGGRCRLQLPGVCTGTAQCVHHVLGRTATGDDPRFLQAVCTACNLHVGQPDQLPEPRGGTRW